MTAESIAQKLWNQCNVLRDDGVTYHQYINELTYILFLKLSDVKGFSNEMKYQLSGDGRNLLMRPIIVRHLLYIESF